MCLTAAGIRRTVTRARSASAEDGAGQRSRACDDAHAKVTWHGARYPQHARHIVRPRYARPNRDRAAGARDRPARPDGSCGRGQASTIPRVTWIFKGYGPDDPRENPFAWSWYLEPDPPRARKTDGHY